nr:hypothetical protein [Desulfobacteraceae bacterium]
AHVKDAGDSFEVMTDQISQLAKRSTDAAKRTEALINHSVEFTRKGETLSKEIDNQLEEAVEGGKMISRLTEEITLLGQVQERGIIEITNAVAQIDDVMKQNTQSASESSAAAKTLEKETEKLLLMVNKFQINHHDDHLNITTNSCSP